MGIPEDTSLDYDVIVVGAGAGGLYAVHRLGRQGLRVLAIEGADGVGGVWYHNRYPGARVDVDSVDYSYHFSDELLEKWTWSERFAAQPELLAYFEFVADTFDLYDKILLSTCVTGAQWYPASAHYVVETSTGVHYSCRFLVMTTGNLTVPRTPAFRGLDRYQGQWVQTSHWPVEEVPVRGRRVAVFGTGSTGIQTIPVLAEQAEHLFVFQRTPHYAVPAHNRRLTADEQEEGISAKEVQELLISQPGGTRMGRPTHPASAYTPAEQRQKLQEQWDRGGQAILGVFLDQSTSRETSELVSEFVRSKIAAKVGDARVRESLLPTAYPIGVKRVALETGYYEAFNRDNVTLVDLRHDPFIEITETGIATESGHFEVDLIVFAIGFVAFTAAIDSANVRNELGETPTDRWDRGPWTLLGLMTPGFPNLLVPTGPGSPSLIANLITQNELAIDWIGDLIAYMDEHGFRSVEPSEDATRAWTAAAAATSDKLLRREVDNYMVKVNADGTRVFIPYAGGLDRYAAECRRLAAEGYPGLVFR
jgi:cation diffusion facilitator CzcD-associated flavoprotein CzcO